MWIRWSSGWLVVPPDLVSDVARAKLQADNGSATPEQLALAEFIETGAFDSHLRRTRHIYRRRRDALVTSLHKHLPNLRLHGVAAGLHVLIELAAGVDERAIVDAAARRSIRVYGGGAYRAKPLAGPPAILVGYGGLPESTIPEAVRELAQILTECGRPKRSGSCR
jgi:GntR family transcriptional regulator / MocR family aminotransferase